MADQILRSKITFGNSDRVEAAKQEGSINEFDILCLDGNSKPKIGWIDRNGNTRIVENKDVILVTGDALPAEGEDEVIYIFKNALYYWNGLEFVSVSAEGLSESEVDDKVSDAISQANAYSDGKLNSALEAYVIEKYELTDVPEGTLISYSDNEIRVMCPKDAVWSKQNVGVGGDPNCYYATLKTYFADDDIVGYIEHLGDQVDAEILTDIKVDENGRRYQPTWLALARYDEATDVWTYYGVTSSEDHYIGWDYRIDQYNSADKMIASDCVRINLSNENCHFSNTPFYVAKAMDGVVETANAYTDKKIAEVASGYEIVEF